MIIRVEGVRGGRGLAQHQVGGQLVCPRSVVVQGSQLQLEQSKEFDPLEQSQVQVSPTLRPRFVF